MSNYKQRIIDNLLARKLRGKGAVLIQGAKWCGKTTTAEQMAKSILYMDDPQKKAQNIRMAEMNMHRLLAGETPRLIDEWQLAPQIWDAIRFEVDHREALGQFILTGSAVSYTHLAPTAQAEFQRLSLGNMEDASLLYVPNKS